MQDRARSLIVVTFGLVFVGATARADRAGEVPARCAEPGLDARGDLVCEGGAPAGTRAWLAGGSIDLNRASAAQLRRLPGVGPRASEAIVEDRAANGPFRAVEALQRVKGIGPKTVARVAPMVRVSDAPGAPPAR